MSSLDGPASCARSTSSRGGIPQPADNLRHGMHVRRCLASANLCSRPTAQFRDRKLEGPRSPLGKLRQGSRLWSLRGALDEAHTCTLNANEPLMRRVRARMSIQTRIHRNASSSLTENSFATSLGICRDAALTWSSYLPSEAATWHTFRSEVTAGGELATAVRTIESTRRRSLAGSTLSAS
jgi:hypothetical protein